MATPYLDLLRAAVLALPGAEGEIDAVDFGNYNTALLALLSSRAVAQYATIAEMSAAPLTDATIAVVVNTPGVTGQPAQYGAGLFCRVYAPSVAANNLTTFPASQADYLWVRQTDPFSYGFGGVPAITFGTAAGTGPVLGTGANAAVGNSRGGVIKFTTGTTPAAGGNILFANFTAPLLGTGAAVLFRLVNTNTGTLVTVADAVATNAGFVVTDNAALAASTPYTLQYIVQPF